MPRKATQRPARRSRRHPAGGGYARGERTRRRIIETAIDMFASLGYERTATRAIAKRAAVSLPALQYYFGGKEGLHLACAEYITADVRVRLTPAAERVSEALSRPRLSRAQLLGLLRMVLEPFLESMATERPESWVLFFTRAQIERSAAFDVLFDRVVGTITRLTAQIVARLIGRAPDDPEALIRVLAVIGPIVVVRRGRPILLRTLGWRDLSGKRLEALKNALWTQIAKGFSPS
jgi:TetR/AcrR family transcriptional regulator, regulator of cefoperazone and chloramphenicol sensitivity